MKRLLLILSLLFSCSNNAPWIPKRVEQEFSYFKKQEKLSKQKIDQIATDPKYDHLLLVKYSIRGNHIFLTHRLSTKNYVFIRAQRIKKSLEKILKSHDLPDMDFIVSLHDAIEEQFDIPIFVMAKHKDRHAQILIPDFEALGAAYQVIKKTDITKKVFPWNQRKKQLIWRGSTAQHPPQGCPTSWNLQDPHCLSRVRLCDYSEHFPELIDAKFTIYAQGAENLPFLEKFKGEFIPYPDQFTYKYQMLIDGNTCSYSNSGWKFFSHSLIFKEDSDHIQWYYSELKPYVHYLPVKEGLHDLLEKLHWAAEHDTDSQAIAQRARQFALTHLTQATNLDYLYHTLLAYNSLNWVD